MAKAKKQTDEAEELSQVLGLSCKTVKVRGEEIEVSEFEIEQLPQLLNLIKELTEKAKGESITDSLLMQSGEIGIRLAMLATGRPREWFHKMPLGDGLALYAAIIEANTSFFAQIDQFTGLVELVAGLLKPMQTSGRASLELSPAADTGSATSAG